MPYFLKMPACWPSSVAADSRTMNAGDLQHILGRSLRGQCECCGKAGGEKANNFLHIARSDSWAA